MQCTYVIGPDGGPYKIGVAKSPKARLKDLQTASPHLLKVHYFRFIDSPNGRFAEGFVHRRLAKHRLEGEWFDVPLETAVAEINAIDPEQLTPAAIVADDKPESRQRAHDRRKVQAGWYKVPVWLDPETRTHLAQLSGAEGLSAQETMRRAIKHAKGPLLC